ncbi:hypothetical protein C8E83_0716 [Frondihabitans australicus]|uniref:Uncharacterized protein n=1 Tax=Frondihabitans australicus TaxID=386892 RepID=A0A495IC91_9MICO|nr:hypothetical protein C8E83_0716 [Frondihabitans australicus]
MYGGGEVSRADVDELRRVLAATGSGVRAHERSVVEGVADPAPGVGGAVGATEAHNVFVDRVTHHPRLWLAGGVVAVVLVAAVSAVIASGVTRAGVEAAADPMPTTEVIGSPPTVTNDGPAAEAAALGAQYFAAPQGRDDHPGLHLHGIVASSTHRVLTQFGPGSAQTRVWVAQADDGSFCLIMAVDPDRGASSCTPEEDVVATGVRLDMLVPGGGSIDVSWDLSSGLLAFSPYPEGVRIDDSGSAAGTE